MSAHEERMRNDTRAPCKIRRGGCKSFQLKIMDVRRRRRRSHHHRRRRSDGDDGVAGRVRARSIPSFSNGKEEVKMQRSLKRPCTHTGRERERRWAHISKHITLRHTINRLCEFRVVTHKNISSIKSHKFRNLFFFDFFSWILRRRHRCTHFSLLP